MYKKGSENMVTITGKEKENTALGKLKEDSSRKNY